ncbi:MAG: hypothetical protein ACREQH_12195 [Candidatus Binatus sp.]
MRPILFAVAIVAFAGCSSVQRDVTHLQREQDAISAATKKIKVVSGANVKGNPPYATLGRAEGYCFNRRNSTGGQLVHGDSLKAAAYRKYGDQVDAIMHTSVWFVADDDYGAFEPYTEGGYLECAGTAVHFTGDSAPATAPAQPPPG